jgi:sigma-B regulation protein RsbU (phosphoserine phosphatase)
MKRTATTEEWLLEAAWPHPTPTTKDWEREVRFASQVQNTFVGARAASVDGAAVYGCSQPHFVVGGDYFDFVHLPDGTLRVLVADVMGKGFGAGMLMMMLRSAVRVASPYFPTPGALLGQLNHLLFEDLQQIASFITVTCADYHPGGLQVTIASAGAPYPLCLRRSSEKVTLEEVRARGVSLGLLPNKNYVDLTVAVAPEDLLLLYTDGILEAKDLTGKELGASGLKALAAGTENGGADALLQRVMQGVASHAKGPVRDDVTAVAIGFCRPAELDV